MKKLLIAICLMLGFTGMVSAQQVKKKVQPKAAKLANAKPAATPAIEVG